EADSEVAAANSKAKGEARSSKEEMLGISVEPLTQDDARDPRLRPVVQRGGGLIVTEVSPDDPAFQRLLAADDGGPDIIVPANGQPTRTRAALRDALRKLKSDEEMTVQQLRRTRAAAGGCEGTHVGHRAREHRGGR